MTIFDLKKTKRRILLNKISPFKNKLFLVGGVLLISAYLISFLLEKENKLEEFIIFFSQLITVAICYFINEGKKGFWKRFMPLFVVIYLRYFFFLLTIVLFLGFFNYELIDESFSLFEIFIEMILCINILVNFASINKNYFLLNKIKN